MTQTAVVILAAGQSTRFKSKKSKVLHLLAGRPVVSYPIEVASALRAKPVLVVRGPGQRDLKEYLRAKGVRDVVQVRPLGTANAVLSARSALSKFDGYVLILCGDVPLVRASRLKDFLNAGAAKNAKLGILTIELKDPTGYGRIVRDLDGGIVQVVEEKDATEDQKNIREVNSGVIFASSRWLFKTLEKVGSANAKNEFYLTDLVTLAVKNGARVLGFSASPAQDFLGINTRVELAACDRIMRERINVRHMLEGVGISDHQNTVIDAGVKIGADTVIMPYSFLLGSTRVGKDCIVENGVVLRDAVVGDGVHIKAYSVIEESSVASGAIVGPFARIRPDSKVGRGARVGNFVELKKCELKEGAKANHLTYLGDVLVGARANIGCGTITCNYDGKLKHKTIIGEGAFVGSDTQFVAPVKIGSGSVVGAGSTITKDVPAGALALSRAPQVVVKGWARKRKA